MSKVKKDNEWLRDRNEELARQAERKMIDPALSQDDRIAATEAAKVYWQLSRSAADTVAIAAGLRSSKFDGPNKGQQKTTADRTEFLFKIAKRARTTKHEAVAEYAITKNGRKVMALWGCEGEQALKKIRAFLRNHKPLENLTFES